MRIIPTKTHGVLDYVVGAALIAAPWMFHFADHDNACYVPIALGGVIILYSFITNYELGVVNIISMPTHLLMDLAVGVLLACSPWLFSFHQYVYVPHLAAG